MNPESLVETMPALGIKLLENRVLDYILAGLSTLALWLTLELLKRYGLKKASQLVAFRSPMVAGFIVRIQEGISPLTLPLIALYFGVNRLHTSTRFDHLFYVLLLFFLSIQLTVLLVKVSDYFIMRLTFGRDPEDLSVNSARRNLKAIAVTVIWIAGVLFFLANIGINITTFVTGLGIGGIAIALAVQSVLADVLSSFSISIDKPFEIGDFVVIDNLRGTVEQIGLKTTRIRSIDGELLVFGNQDLTKARIQNYKRMQSRRVLFRIGVVYGTRVAELRAIPDLVKSIVESQEGLAFDRCHFIQFGDFSLNFEIVYFVNDRDYTVYCEHQQAINLALAEEFEKRGIEFAFPTQTLHVGSMPSQPQVGGA